LDASAERVGIILGEKDHANSQFEVDPDGAGEGSLPVAVTTTIIQDQLDELINLAHTWQFNNPGTPFGPDVQYPTATLTLPNNRPNPTFTSYPETGPSTPLYSTRLADGYFVGNFALPTPTIVPIPDSPGNGQCG